VIRLAAATLIVCGCAAPPPRPERPGACGDVVPAHPTPQAIRRLATTTDEIRILVYGQSVSDQPWWLMVRDWLRARYPRGNLVMEQHARGGCAAQCLIGRDPWIIDHQSYNRVPQDVFAWRPDLIIFNVYGRHDDYDTLIKGFRQGCAAFDDHPSPSAHCPPDARHPEYRPAEVVLQTYYQDQDHYRPSLPALPPIAEGEWDHWMATTWIPAVARRYGVSVARIWEPWGAYLQAHHLKARSLIPDGEYLTEEGNRLMAALTERSLCHPPR
jgi:hypothetical protein